MGRFIDLCGEVAAAAEEGAGQLVLSIGDRERMLDRWSDEEIDDALDFVRESLFQGELIEATDSLSDRLVALLSPLADTFDTARTEGLRLDLDEVGRVARRLARVEEILEYFRDRPVSDRSRFHALRERLADLGIEDDGSAEDDDP